MTEPQRLHRILFDEQNGNALPIDLADHREDLGLFLRDSLPEFERLLRDSRTAAQEFRELSRSLKADPSQLLYEPSYRGVEIPR